MTSELNVGIIGANASGGWAGEAHVPAIRHVAGLKLEAIATQSRASADAAAQAFGVDDAYASGFDLIADPKIDIATVATRVPDHRDLLLAAIAAGKHVYSEWPLGRGAAEAVEIAKAARGGGRKHAIGLQLRGSPAVIQARDIIRSGRLGRLLRLSAFSSTAGFGPDVPPQFAYLEDPAAFANLITIQGAHTLDLVAAIGGGFDALSATTSRQFPEIRVGEPRQAQRRTTFDHLLAQGWLRDGTPFSLEVAGGRTASNPFHLELSGEDGTLRLEGGAPRGVQASRVELLVNGVPEPGGHADGNGLGDAAVNVAGVYRALHEDITAGTATVADFTHAERLSRLIEGVLRSSTEGRRLDADDWPTA